MWLALLASLPVLVWWGRRSLAGLPGVRSVAALVVRCIVIAAIAAALSRAQLVRVHDDMAVAFAVDASLSVPSATQKQSLDLIATWLKEGATTRQRDDQVALITFGKNAAIDQAFTTGALNTAATVAVIEPDHTNLAAAIRTAVAAMPQAGRKRIVLFTDANENAGAALAEAATAKSSGVRIDCLPVRYSYSRELMVEKVTAPSEAQTGKTVGISVLVRAFNDAKATLRLIANGQQIASEQVTLRPGINPFFIERPLPLTGIYDFKAMIEPHDRSDDSLYQNNEATAFTIVRGENKILLVQGAPEDGANLVEALRLAKLQVDVVRAESLPPSMMLLTAYDVIILANVPAFDLPSEVIKTLASAVREYGVGLIMVGGNDSFGAGGWKGTAVEEAMPVSMDVKDQQVIPSGALVVIMHTCEFADGNTWGIKISKAAVDTLGQYDEFGLLYYGAGDQWLIPLQPVADRSRINATIDGMRAGDMPSFFTTLDMAEKALLRSKASVKHVVIVSDGDAEPPLNKDLLRMASENITVSTICVFPHDPSSSKIMQAIASVCKGRFYEPKNAKELPQIMVKEARNVRRNLINEKPFIPAMQMLTVPTTGFRNGDFPVLQGYVISTPKPLAELPLVTPSGDPLLAHWQYGLGRSVAFTSDAKARWASSWLTWNDYQRFWGQVTEWAERKIETSEFTTNCRISGETASISVDAIDRKGEFVNFLAFTGKVLAPDGTTQTVKLEQTGPGHYEGTFKADQVGTYVPLVSYTDSNNQLRTYTSAVTVPFSPEYRALSTNDVLLKEICDVTGGKVINQDDDVFRRDFPPESFYTDVWQWAIAAAAVLFLFDVFLRRVIIDYAKVASAIRDALWWVPFIGEGRKRRTERLAYTAALLSVKQKARLARQEAAQKFVAATPTPAAPLRELEREQAMSRSRAKAEKIGAVAPPPKEVAKETPKEGEPIFTSQLLEAKRRAMKDRKSGPPPQT